MRRFINLVVLLTLIVSGTSCSRKLAVINPDKLGRRKTVELVSAMDSLSRLRPKYFYTKIKCVFSDTNQNLNFKTSIRMAKDSIINALITYASLPIVNSLISPDSVILSNRREKCVIRQNLSYIKEQFGIAFDYRNIEELFLGLPVGFDTTQKYFQIHDPYNYIVSSHKKREIRRENRNRPERERINDRFNRRDDEDENDVILKYYLSNDIRSIKRISINSPEDSTTIDIQYLSRDSVELYMIPNDVVIEIVTPRNRMVINMNYDKSEVNLPQEIYFVIPKDYEACSPK
jgi:hypothetical protein